MPSFNDATMVETWYDSPGYFVKKVSLACTCDSGDGSFSKILSKGFDGFILKAVTIPDTTTPPTDLYNVLLYKDVVAGTGDFLQGVCVGQSSTVVTQNNIVIGTTKNHPMIKGDEIPTLHIDSNIINSAKTTVVIYYSNLS